MLSPVKADGPPPQNSLILPIKSNTPVPAPVGGGSPKYPWGQLEVGDYFEVQGRSSKRWSSQCAVRSIRDGRRYSVRTQPDRGFRIYRVG
jgi:hypothetical protein